MKLNFLALLNDKLSIMACDYSILLLCNQRKNVRIGSDLLKDHRFQLWSPVSNVLRVLPDGDLLLCSLQLDAMIMERRINLGKSSWLEVSFLSCLDYDPPIDLCP